jgi:long-chain acyl-CoA synthetase
VTILRYPEILLDGLLRRAAHRDPHGTAVTTERGSLTFAALDREADRIAHWLTGVLGPRDAVVGVANVLDPAFPAAYYGTARAGHTIALVNPLLGEAALHHVCATAGLEIAFVPAATAELLTKIGDRLPRLRTVVVTDAADGVVPGESVPLAAALAAVPHAPFEAPAAADPETVACVQFTTGTTGRPRGVRLTHRNLVANAAQITLAHRLDGDSVTLNHLPLYHVMHLNSAVYAGAAQVLCREPDPVASLAVAARTGATHYYGLPARLHRLAADDRLGRPAEGIPAGPRLTAVMSGGTALAPAAARRLRDALRVPVVQGYGLAELSPLAHNQLPGARPEAGAVGPPVPGTECRIVSLDDRAPVDVWATGEVQIRGPQVMAGYLDGVPSPVDADGWLSTGDVGYLDSDGGLHLVDRLGDVFKYDNELVSPSHVERILAEDPRVAECIVADWPDSVHGAVVWAGVVLRETPDGGPADALPDLLDSVGERANARLGHADRIRRLEALDAVPRNAGGKPARRELRERLRAGAAAEHTA